jgi:hypothetical protein
MFIFKTKTTTTMKNLLLTLFIASYSFMAIDGDNAFEKDVEKFMELNGSK